MEASARARWGGGLMNRHTNRLSGRLRGMVVAGSLMLAACTSGNAAEPSASPQKVSPEATGRQTVSVQTPTPTPSRTPSVEDQVETAYRTYLDTTVAAMESGDPTLIEAARGQALAAAEARVAALVSNGRLAQGALVPAIQDISVSDGTAKIADCYRNDIIEHDRETGEELDDRRGLRSSAEASLELEGDSWVVADFRQGDPCVPAELATALEEAYLGFWAAVAAAGRPPDPDHPDLLATTDGEQLDGLRDRLADFRDMGHEVRDNSMSHARAVQILQDDTIGVVRDCRELDPEGGVYDTETGDLVAGGANEGQRALWEARLERSDGSWKVVDADLVEEDSGCEPADF